MSDWTVGAPAEIGMPTGMVSLADMLESVLSDAENASLPFHLVLSTQNTYVLVK
jgi:hypothetical protein